MPSDIADKLELKLSLPENVLVTVDNITEITANKSGISIDKSSLDEGIASVEVNGNIIKINGISDGETSVAITDGKTTETINITVSSLTASVDGAEFVNGCYNVTAGTEYTLKVTDSGVDVDILIEPFTTLIEISFETPSSRVTLILVVPSEMPLTVIVPSLLLITSAILESKDSQENSP